MNSTKARRSHVVAVLAALMFCFSVCSAYGQNTISGYVFGLNRQPISDLHVELQNDYYQTIQRTRTSGAGYYTFTGLGSGRFTVKVFTFATDYEETDRSIEIQNFSTSTPTGSQSSGFSNEQVDFYLKLRHGLTPENVAVFAQDVPADAKKLYEKAIGDLDNKHKTEGLGELRSAIEIFPKYFAALERLGTEYIAMGKPEAYQAAEILFALAVEVNPRAFKSWHGLAYARYSEGKYAEATTAIAKAIEISSYSPEALFLSGLLMRQNKKYQEAEKQMLKAKEISKDTIPQIHWELALLYGNYLKRYADAAKELRAFLKAEPNAKDTEKIKQLIADFDAKAQKPEK
jgi:tetratricopeptide (TPR) repeat protein